jgi:hypothetical protein
MVKDFICMFQMGFDGLFFGRADHNDIQQRRMTKTQEMVWKSSVNLGEWWTRWMESNLFIWHMFAGRESWLLAGILPNNYGGPHSFCFDFSCGDPPMMVSFSSSS